MIEIILIYFLCRWCSRKAKAKGYSGGWFAVMGAALWIGMEIIGCIVGVVIMLQSGSDYLIAYFFALAGAAIGALIALFIVRHLRERSAPSPRATAEYAAGPNPIAVPQRQLYCRRCGSPIPQGSLDCEKCGEPVV